MRDKLDALNNEFKLIQVLAAQRRKFLEERRELFKFIEEAEEEELWVQEKFQLIKSLDLGHDLNSILNLLQKHEQLEAEIKHHKQRIDKIIQSGQGLVASKSFTDAENKIIAQRSNQLKNRYEILYDAAKNRRISLEDSYSSQQYYADSNEAESWIADKMAIVKVEDYGKDEASAQALLQRHARLEDEIKAYQSDIQRLDELTNVLAGQRRFSSFPTDMRENLLKVKNGDSDDIAEDNNQYGVELVPVEEEVEEIIEKVVTEPVVQEISVPCVRALYPYEGKNFSIQRAETIELKEKTNNDWWLVENKAGQTGYVPANYVREIGVQKVPKIREKSVKKRDVVKAKKIVMKPKPKLISKASMNANKNAKKPVIQPHHLQHLDSGALKDRQIEIRFSYNRLKEAAIERKHKLENAINLYKWQRQYDECLKWIRDKQVQMKIDKDKSLVENPDSVKRMYQAFNTDFLANQSEIAQLEKLSEDLVKILPPNQADLVNKRQVELTREWNKLLELKKYWDNAIKAITCIENFNLLYADVKELIYQKLKTISLDDINTSDVHSVRALQMKQDKLEREIGPLETSINNLRKTAEDVCKYFPQEKPVVQRKLNEIDSLWLRLKEEVADRKAKLDEKHGLQRFENEANDLLKHCANLLASLKELEKPHDLKQCEEMMKKFENLKEDLNNSMYKFEDLKELGKKLLSKKHAPESIKRTLEIANEEKLNAIVALDRKTKYLDDYHKYLKFKQDANNLELQTQDQEAYLQYEDLGSSLSNVAALQKRHDEFKAKVNAQDEKVNSLIDAANKLIQQKHFASIDIDKQAKELLQHRKRLHDKTKEREYKLNQSKDFFEFKSNCDEFDSWINERKRFIASIDHNVSNEKLAEIERKLNKYEALEKELAANYKRLEKLQNDGNDLISKKRNYAADEIRFLLESIEENWNDLVNQWDHKDKLLKEAKQRAELDGVLSGVDTRMDNLEKTLAKVDRPKDLRGAKAALKKHQDLENQMVVEADLVKDMANPLKQAAGSDINKKALENAVKDYLLHFAKLKPVLDARKNDLETNLNIQQLLFDIDEELKWMDEIKQNVESYQVPNSLFDAQNLSKKHAENERQINNHKANVEKLESKGEKLLQSPLTTQNAAYPDLQRKLRQLKDGWKDLGEIATLKKKALDENLNEQQCLDDLNKAITWIAEKRIVVNDKLEPGADSVAINKKLAKLDALQHDLVGYKEMVNGLRGKIPNSVQVQNKFAEVENQLNEMEMNIAERKKELEVAFNTQEFNREAAEVLGLIEEKRVLAQSEDVGHDYEHLMLINEKFKSLNEQIKSLEPRYTRVRNLGSELLNKKPADSKTIRKTLDDLKNSWGLLQDDVKHRGLLLQSAGEIHKFNQDAQDIMRRIEEKELSLPSDVGKDFNSCQGLVRKHEIFTEELNALTPQIKELHNQSEILRKKYEGDTAENIQEVMEDLLAHHADLSEKVDKRQKDLQYALQYFEFMIFIKDVNTWIEETRRAILLQPNCQDLFSAQQYKQEHDQLQLEMTQRDDIFRDIIEAANVAKKTGHPRFAEIQTQTEKSLKDREELFRLWTKKNLQLECLLLCHTFYRDANQLLTLLASQETYLKNAIADPNNLSQSVDIIENQIKTHENYGKKIEKQEDKIDDLLKFAENILEKEADQTNRTSQLMEELLNKRQSVSDLCNDRYEQLKDSLLQTQWKRDVDEFILWIDERLRFSRSLGISSKAKANSSLDESLAEKVKLFQRLKAFDAEIVANRPRFNDLCKRGEIILRQKPKLPPFVKQTLENLNEKWYELENESREKAKELAEAQDILEFNDEIEQIEGWLKEMELMINTGDTGKDFEHCMQLLKKVEEAQSDIYEQRLKQVINNGDKLVRQGRTDRDMVLEKRNRLLQRSNSIKAGIENYRKKLYAALEVHAFNRDYDEIKERINQKSMILKNDDYGRTLDAVQAVQSKTAEIEQDLKAIENKLNQLKSEAERISNKYPQSKENVLAKLLSVKDDWENLLALLAERKRKLEMAFDFQTFMREYHDLKAWASDMNNRIQMNSEPLSLSEAETFYNLHQERKTEIDGKNHRFLSLREFSRRLKQDDNKEIARCLKELTEHQQNLEKCWFEKQLELQHSMEFQNFKENFKQLEQWIKTTEKPLKNPDTGNSIQAVESLINKHENIEHSIKTQAESFTHFEETGQEMIRQKYKQNEATSKLLNDMNQKRKDLENLSLARRKALDESRDFQHFLLNFYDAKHWIKEKTSSATDKAYMDLLNLQMKIQRHQNFMTEVKKTGTKRIEDVKKEAEALLSRNHSKAQEIKENLKDIEAEWNALLLATEMKRKHLDDAHKFVMFSRLCDDLSAWIDEVEIQLSSEENGKDLTSCKMLLLRQEALAREIKLNEPKINEIEKYVETNQDNFMFSNIESKAQDIINRFNSLQEPSLIRTENLQESLAFFELLHDLEDFEDWIDEKLPLSLAEELGTNLEETKSLHKKHASLEQELQAHNPLINNALKNGKQLIDRKHYASMQIASKIAEIDTKFKQLKEAVESRGLKLQDALEVQTFYSDCNELVMWLTEKAIELRSFDERRDELTTISHLKKIEALKNEIKSNQYKKLTKLVEYSNSLQARNHYDKKNIMRKQAELESIYQRSLDQLNESEQHMIAMLKVFEFQRECDTTINWIKEQEIIASSQDYGSDLEHAETLLKRFNEFMKDLEKNGERVKKIDILAQRLCENKYTPPSFIDLIDESCSSINDRWSELNRIAEARRQTLEGAIEVHAFDKDCDDLITWATEKENFLKTEDVGYDLASVHTLAKQQEALEAEFISLSEELERLNKEADRLCHYFPETKDHIEARLEDADGKYNELLKNLSSRKDRIQQTQALFVFLNGFHELSEWLRETLLTITSYELANDVNGAELLIRKNKEHKAEIDLQQNKIQKFIMKGEELLNSRKSNFHNDVKGKIEAINTANKNLLETWHSRQDLYEQNLEYSKLSRDIKLLDDWLTSKDALVHTDIVGDSVSAVESLIKQHQDFEKMLDAMENRFDALKRETKIEKAFKELKQREMAQKEQYDLQIEEEKKKDNERKKKLEKRRAEERRRTQEIIFSVTPTTGTNSYSRPNTVDTNGESQDHSITDTTSTTVAKSSSFNAGTTTQLTDNNKPSGTSLSSSSFRSTKKDRNRTRSIRDKYKLPLRLTEPTIGGYLNRKQEFQKGGQRAPIREYQSFYTTIHSNLMCFFADRKDYNDLNAVCPPVNMFNAKLSVLQDPTIQRNVIHIETFDGAEYLFDCEDVQDLNTWVERIAEATSKWYIHY